MATCGDEGDDGGDDDDAGGDGDGDNGGDDGDDGGRLVSEQNANDAETVLSVRLEPSLTPGSFSAISQLVSRQKIDKWSTLRLLHTLRKKINL